MKREAVIFLFLVWLGLTSALGQDPAKDGKEDLGDCTLTALGPIPELNPVQVLFNILPAPKYSYERGAFKNEKTLKKCLDEALGHVKDLREEVNVYDDGKSLHLPQVEAVQFHFLENSDRYTVRGNIQKATSSSKEHDFFCSLTFFGENRRKSELWHWFDSPDLYACLDLAFEKADDFDEIQFQLFGSAYRVDGTIERD